MNPVTDRESGILRQLEDSRRRLDVGFLQEALRYPDLAVRESAARYLGLLRVEEAVPEILRLLEVRDDGLKNVAIKALARIGDPAATARLRAIAVADAPDGKRSTAAVALAELGDPEGLALLGDWLSHPKKDWRRWAARELGRLGGADSDALLQEAERTAPPLERRRLRRARHRAASAAPKSRANAAKSKRARVAGHDYTFPVHRDFLRGDDPELVAALGYSRPGLLLLTQSGLISARHTPLRGKLRIRRIPYDEIRAVEEITGGGDAGAIRISTVRRRVSFRSLESREAAIDLHEALARHLTSESAREATDYRTRFAGVLRRAGRWLWRWLYE